MPAPAPARPLVVTGDPLLLDDVLRLAAAAGTVPEVVADAGAARRSWSTAPVVLVGADQVAAALRARLPRRSGVVLLGADLDDGGVWQRAVGLGAEHVWFLPDHEAEVTTALADARDGAADLAPLLAVVGGRGGAGATTLAVGLALAGVRRGQRALLVDGDPLGGGVDLVLGGESDPGLRWPELSGTHGRLSAPALAAAVPVMSGTGVLSWDRGHAHSVPPEAMEAVLGAARRCHDLVVVDLPRRPDAAGRVALAAATTTLLVVPAEVRAAAAASRVASSVGLLCRDLRVVVRGPSPLGLGGGEIARALGLPLAGEMRAERHLDAQLDRGDPPGRRTGGPLAGLCDRLVEECCRERSVPGRLAA